MLTPLLKDSRTQKVLGAIAAVLAIIGGTVIVWDGDGPGPNPAHTVTIPRTLPLVAAKVDTADPGRQPDALLKATAPAFEEVNTVTESGLRGEQPSAANVAAQDQAAHDDQLPLVTADAAPTSTGCLSRFSPNYSSRRGVSPRVITLHETVSGNKPGWDDVNAVGVWLSSPRAQASANYILDREGHCLYSVRESDKAWTQAAANPWSISWEIVNSTHEANLIDGKGRAFLVVKLDGISSRWDIPLRVAKVTGDCRVVAAGVTDHQSWGACGGGHVDISPFRAALPGIVADARRHCQDRYHARGRKAPARCRANG